jgi:hypothetical protein
MTGFYTFEQSAHSPMFEEPEKMARVIREDVPVCTSHLADAPQSFGAGLPLPSPIRTGRRRSAGYLALMR